MEPALSEPIHAPPPPPHRSNRIFYPLEGYLSIITENVEKIFLIENSIHRNDHKIYSEMISNINSEKWLGAMKLKIDSTHSN